MLTPTKQPEKWDSPLEENQLDPTDTQKLKLIDSIPSIKEMFTRLPLSEGMAIGGVTGLGYFSAYLSDASYKAYFGLPTLYADVNLNVMILSIFSLVMVIWIIAMTVFYPALRKFGPFIFPLLIPLIAAALLALKLEFRIANSLGSILSTFFVFILATGSLMVFVYFRKWLLASLFFIILVIFTSRFSGEFIASNQTEFLVAQGPTPYVIVDIYKDSFIMMPVDLKNRTLLPEYRFVDQKSEMGQALKLQKMEIGPLKLKTEPSK